jgi:hypothetical protein
MVGLNSTDEGDVAEAQLGRQRLQRRGLGAGADQCQRGIGVPCLYAREGAQCAGDVIKRLEISGREQCRSQTAALAVPERHQVDRVRHDTRRNAE